MYKNKLVKNKITEADDEEELSDKNTEEELVEGQVEQDFLEDVLN